MSSLSALLEQSRQLNNKLQSADLPALQLGLDQIEAQSRKAAVRARAAPTSASGLYGHDGESGGIAADDEQIARACACFPFAVLDVANSSHKFRQYLLANAQVDTSTLSRTLNALQPATAFAPLTGRADNDIPSICRQAHESILIAAIEEGRRDTIRDFYATLRQDMMRDWEKKKMQIFDELARHHPALVADSDTAMGDDSTSGHAPGGSGSPLRNSSRSGRRVSTGYGSAFGSSAQSNAAAPQSSTAEAGNDLHLHTKSMKYEQAVARINAYRKEGLPVGVLTLLANAAATAGSNDVRVVISSVMAELTSRVRNSAPAASL